MTRFTSCNLIYHRQTLYNVDLCLRLWLVLAKWCETKCVVWTFQPERINPPSGSTTYDIRSDVWSLGISMIELATTKHPYQRWKTPFEQLKQVWSYILATTINKWPICHNHNVVKWKWLHFPSCFNNVQWFVSQTNLYYALVQVVQDDPPRLPTGTFTTDFENFIAKWYVRVLSVTVMFWIWRRIVGAVKTGRNHREK